jgi:acrylyl-CoA reductase (NADPH)
VIFRAFVVNKSGDDFSAEVTELDESGLPEGDVTVRVEWSDVNYKDGLACLPKGRVINDYPMTPGIDLAGEVTASSDGRFQDGDRVLLTGYDLGVSHPGGYAELARVPADWLVPLPDGLTTQEAMALGTAGFTAALSVYEFERNGIGPDAGPILVTGATGGVGSTAVAMLAGMGYTVVASTGKDTEHDFLRAIGASEILSREEVSAESDKPIGNPRWAGAVDPVGGSTTAYLLRTTKPGGVVALSGLTGGTVISTSVFPFILRGTKLVGIDSVYASMPVREVLWRRLGADLKPRGLLESIAHETTLEGIPDATTKILKGEIRGRTLVKLAD